MKCGDIMNIDNLNAEIARRRLTIPVLAEKMGISKKTLYSRIKQQTSFTQKEIVSISKILNLNDQQIMDIFFNHSVS